MGWQDTHDPLTYKSWDSMRQRCNNVKAPNYAEYGGRGITHDPRWSKFENFLNDMGPRPMGGFTLGRKETNGNYCKDNCRWETADQQAQNRRTCVLLTFKDKTQNITEWAQELNVNRQLLYSRYRRYGNKPDLLFKGIAA